MSTSSLPMISIHNVGLTAYRDYCSIDDQQSFKHARPILGASTASIAEPVTAIPIDTMESDDYNIEDSDFAEVLEILVEGDSMQWDHGNDDTIGMPVAQAEAYAPVFSRQSSFFNQQDSNMESVITAVPYFDVDLDILSFPTNNNKKLSNQTLRGAEYHHNDPSYSYCQEVDGSRGAEDSVEWDIEELQNYLYLQDIENLEDCYVDDNVTSSPHIINSSLEEQLYDECQDLEYAYSMDRSLSLSFLSNVFGTDDYNCSDNLPANATSETSQNTEAAVRNTAPSHSAIGQKYALDVSQSSNNGPLLKRVRDALYEQRMLYQEQQLQKQNYSIGLSQSVNVDTGKSRRQRATSMRTRERGKFKKNTVAWISVTDLFDS